MNDSPTPEPLGGDAQAAPSPPPFRMPDGAPAGTLARGSLPSPEPEPSLSALPSPEEEPVQAVDFAQPEDDWESLRNLESADGRPIESPYMDETALAHAMLSEDARLSPGFDYPLEPSSGHDFSDIQASASPDAYLDEPATPLRDEPEDLYSDPYEASYDAPSGFEVDVPHEDYSDHQLATATSGGAAPPTVPSSTILEEHDENAPHNDREMGLVEHLGELRTRIMWCVAAITLAMMGTWNYARPIEEMIIAPVKQALKDAGQKDGQIIVISPTEGFMLQFNISLISALIISSPFLLFQIWKFIVPAMTKNERKFTGIMVPFSSLLFFMGCALAYMMSPLFFAFFAMFVAPGVVANWSLASTAELLAKMLLVCGVCFQVPVFTIFLNKSEMVSRNVLIEYWRHVVVVIFIVVAIITPTWDPVSLMVCALPPCVLYALSIWLVKYL